MARVWQQKLSANMVVHVTATFYNCHKGIVLEIYQHFIPLLSKISECTQSVTVLSTHWTATRV